MKATHVELPRGMRAAIISDLHLHDEEPANLRAFLHFADMLLERTEPFALFVLGDLFEVWIGDDAEPSMASRLVTEVFRALASSGRPVFLMRGNRDFLMGKRFCKAAGAVLLEDVCVLELNCNSITVRAVLAHGDSLCTDDLNYQRFRKLVRGRAWQADFLAKSLDEREAIARDLRDRSEQTKSQMGFTDVNQSAALELMRAFNAPLLIHGHTHEGRSHFVQGFSRAGTVWPDAQRHVTSDWHAGPRARGDMLWLGPDGTRRQSVY